MSQWGLLWELKSFNTFLAFFHLKKNRNVKRQKEKTLKTAWAWPYGEDQQELLGTWGKQL